MAGVPSDDKSPDPQAQIRASVRALCAKFPGDYWRRLDRERAYPTEFVEALTEGGFLAALIPEQYGGSGLTLTDAAAVLEEIHACGSGLRSSDGTPAMAHHYSNTSARPLFRAVTSRSTTRARKLTTLPSRHSSVRMVSPGNTGAEKRPAIPVRRLGS